MTGPNGPRRKPIKERTTRAPLQLGAKNRLSSNIYLKELNDAVAKLRSSRTNLVNHFLNAKITAAELKKRGYLRRDLVAVGLNSRELKEIGFTLEDYIHDLLLRYTGNDMLISNTFDLEEFHLEGFTKEELEKSTVFGMFVKTYFDLSHALRFKLSKEFIKKWFS